MITKKTMKSSVHTHYKYLRKNHVLLPAMNADIGHLNTDTLYVSSNMTFVKKNYMCMAMHLLTIQPVQTY